MVEYRASHKSYKGRHEMCTGKDRLFWGFVMEVTENKQKKIVKHIGQH